ncbi:MAG: NADH-quinone oxidoreductase subunit L, partial [Caulobacteraceae bacterium]|nr:NADH-quinone oxidoreductase subunit L [Caulobacteraceae bacterium]
MTPQSIVTVLVLAPLLGAAIAGLTGRRIGNIASQAVTTGLLLLACALAWCTFAQVVGGGWAKPFTVEIAPFINVGKFQSDWSIRIDTLSAVMLIVVTTVSSLVHIYSWGYMA